jgi:hypothetical protein
VLWAPVLCCLRALFCLSGLDSLYLSVSNLSLPSSCLAPSSVMLMNRHIGNDMQPEEKNALYLQRAIIIELTDHIPHLQRLESLEV